MDIKNFKILQKYFTNKEIEYIYNYTKRKTANSLWPKPTFGKKRFDLKIGKRKIPKNEKGRKRLVKIIKMWDWYANFSKHKMFDEYLQKNLKSWNPKLKDIEKNKYPSYILDYEKELQKFIRHYKKQKLRKKLQ